MKKANLLIIAILLFLPVFTIAEIKTNTAVPPGAVPATPNMIYYAGGSCVFYDSAGNQLLSVNATEAGWSGTPAKAAWVVITPSSGGYWEFPNYSGQAPTHNKNEYMRPFMSADTIYNELIVTSLNTIALEQRITKNANLLYQPKKILSVKSYNGAITYTEGTDYTVSGRTITQVASRMSTNVSILAGKRGNGTPNGLTNTGARSWVCVTYIPDRTVWNVPSILTYKGDKLPKVMAKLKNKQPITIGALGMSITAGLNVSGFAGDDKNFTPTAPYMHSYVDLFSEQLQKIFGSQITVFNASVGGKTAAWADQYVNALVVPNNPDLVLVDHGMNDIWGTSNASFKNSIQSVVNKLKAGNPNVEIILVGNMLPDDGGDGSPSGGANLMKGLTDQFKAIESTYSSGVVTLDMTAMSDVLYQRKGVVSCVSNSLHPNDYLARWYAHGLVELFSKSIFTDVKSPIDSNSQLFTIYPNPTNKKFVLKMAEELLSQNPVISIFDITGKKIRTFQQASVSQTYSCDELNLLKGVYFLTSQTNNKAYSQKLVVL
jgi:hypothetical protein